MKALLLLLSLLLTIGCSSELDRCMEKKAEEGFNTSIKTLEKNGRKPLVNMIERECNKQGIY